jgi:hypothetical protein
VLHFAIRGRRRCNNIYHIDLFNKNTISLSTVAKCNGMDIRGGIGKKAKMIANSE